MALSPTRDSHTIPGHSLLHTGGCLARYWLALSQDQALDVRPLALKGQSAVSLKAECWFPVSPTERATPTQGDCAELRLCPCSLPRSHGCVTLAHSSPGMNAQPAPSPAHPGSQGRCPGEALPQRGVRAGRAAAIGGPSDCLQSMSGRGEKQALHGRSSFCNFMGFLFFFLTGEFLNR